MAVLNTAVKVSRGTTFNHVLFLLVLPHRNTLAQLKDAYTKLFEDYKELKEEQKKKEASLSNIIDNLI